MFTAPATRFRSLARREALLVLALVAAAVACFIAVSRQDARPAGPKDGSTDVALYTRVVERVHAGEAYYDVFAAELRARGYPTRSVFNWRTPLPLSLMAFLPDPGWGRILLGVCAAAAIGLTCFSDCGKGRYFLASIQTLFLFAALAPAFMPHSVMFSEVWAGTLIVLSLGAYGLGWQRAGAVAGLLALFCRELAAPYVLVCVFLAWRKKRRAELYVWLAGLAGYAAYFALHAAAVTSRIAVSDVGLGSWIRFGGPRFLLDTGRVGLLLGVPLGVAALYLPLALLGLAGRVDPAARRMVPAVAIYLAAFSIVGRPANFYWGALYSPMLALGVAWSLPALRDLLRALARRPLN